MGQHRQKLILDAVGGFGLLACRLLTRQQLLAFGFGKLTIANIAGNGGKADQFSSLRLLNDKLVVINSDRFSCLEMSESIFAASSSIAQCGR
jgi:hypothetical protein